MYLFIKRKWNKNKYTYTYIYDLIIKHLQKKSITTKKTIIMILNSFVLKYIANYVDYPEKDISCIKKDPIPFIGFIVSKICLWIFKTVASAIFIPLILTFFIVMTSFVYEHVMEWFFMDSTIVHFVLLGVLALMHFALILFITISLKTLSGFLVFESFKYTSALPSRFSTVSVFRIVSAAVFVVFLTPHLSSSQIDTNNTSSSTTTLPALLLIPMAKNDSLQSSVSFNNNTFLLSQEYYYNNNNNNIDFNVDFNDTLKENHYIMNLLNELGEWIVFTFKLPLTVYKYVKLSFFTFYNQFSWTIGGYLSPITMTDVNDDGSLPFSINVVRRAVISFLIVIFLILPSLMQETYSNYSHTKPQLAPNTGPASNITRQIQPQTNPSTMSFYKTLSTPPPPPPPSLSFDH